jgi:membrane-associated phospholipid phosphatase
MKIRLLILITSFLISTGLFAQVDSILPSYQDTLPPDSIVIDTAKAVTNLPQPDSIPKPELKAEPKVYILNRAFDIPVTAIGAGWSIYNFTKIYSKGSSSSEEILSLKETDVPPFDRWAIRPYDAGLDRFSYIPFYAAIPLPLLYSIADETLRKDFFKISFLYLEALSITGLLGTNATYFVDRYRPYTYTAETDFDKRLSQNAKNSFYAGHVEIIAVSTFFIAKVHNDYNPGSKSNWLFFAAASAATLGMSYVRLQGGMHFPSDIVLGITTGTLAGILVPHFHKNKDLKKSFSLLPVKTKEGYALMMLYEF